MASQLPPLRLREAVNVPDLKKRDAIVRQIRRIRADAVLDKNTIEWYNANRLPAGEAPLDSSWCDEIIAWCDGKGPLPLDAK